MKLTRNVMVSIHSCVAPITHGKGVLGRIESSKVQKAEGKGHLGSRGEAHALKLICQVGGAADVVQDSPYTLAAPSQQPGARHCPLREAPQTRQDSSTTRRVTCGVHHACPKWERVRHHAKPAVPWLLSAAGGPVLEPLGVICGPPAA